MPVRLLLAYLLAIGVGIGSVELSSALGIDGFEENLVLFALIAGFAPLGVLLAVDFGPSDPSGRASLRRRG